MENLIEEINRFKQILNYGILNEQLDATLKGFLKNAIKKITDDTIKSAINTSVRDAVQAGVTKFTKKVFNKNVYTQLIDKLNAESTMNDIINKVTSSVGRELSEVEKNAIKTSIADVGRTQGAQILDDITKQTDEVLKSTTKSTTNATSTALTVGVENLDNSAKKTANSLVVLYGDDVAKVKQLLPASGKNIAANNRRFFVDFFGKAKLITDVGGRKIMTRRNLLIAAAIIGISYLTLESDLEAEGVQVESDTVDTTSCLGDLKDSDHHPGRKYYVYEPVGGFVYYYYDSGAFYFVNEILKQQYPKGSNNYLKFYCNGNTIVPTKETVGIDGKPLGATTPKSSGESPVTGGDTYTGGSGWISLGPTYDKEILQALGNNEDRRLNDEDIKNIYNKLKTAGKVN